MPAARNGEKDVVELLITQPDINLDLQVTSKFYLSFISCIVKYYLHSKNNLLNIIFFVPLLQCFQQLLIKVWVDWAEILKGYGSLSTCCLQSQGSLCYLDVCPLCSLCDENFCAFLVLVYWIIFEKS